MGNNGADDYDSSHGSLSSLYYSQGLLTPLRYFRKPSTMADENEKNQDYKMPEQMLPGGWFGDIAFILLLLAIVLGFGGSILWLITVGLT